MCHLYQIIFSPPHILGKRWLYVFDHVLEFYQILCIWIELTYFFLPVGCSNAFGQWYSQNVFGLMLFCITSCPLLQLCIILTNVVALLSAA